MDDVLQGPREQLPGQTDRLGRLPSGAEGARGEAVARAAQQPLRSAAILGSGSGKGGAGTPEFCCRVAVLGRGSKSQLYKGRHETGVELGEGRTEPCSAAAYPDSAGGRQPGPPHCGGPRPSREEAAEQRLQRVWGPGACRVPELPPTVPIL